MKNIKVLLIFLTTILFISAHYLHTVYYLVGSAVIFGIFIHALIVDITLISAIILQVILLLIIIKEVY